ncbi:hypothetical protein RRF57_005565 [Xylaria bambusicola]|uniref:Uncharacterized protein n=1 Tax=Xylaria bambusicola TaxID=326684 RepID=A0AAN7UCU6_9PEZI
MASAHERESWTLELPTKCITLPLVEKEYSMIQNIWVTGNNGFNYDQSEGYHNKSSTSNEHWEHEMTSGPLYDTNKYPNVKSCWRIIIPSDMDLGDLIFDMSTLDGPVFYKKWKQYSYEYNTNGQRLLTLPMR